MDTLDGTTVDAIDNLNTRLYAIILKEREKYTLEKLQIIENRLLDVLPEEEVYSYMKKAKEIVFKK
tara:strand:- start:617 stop:814 length:198 start_codon:yes stop_codon:yes gene_type:complete